MRSEIFTLPNIRILNILGRWAQRFGRNILLVLLSEAGGSMVLRNLSTHASDYTDIIIQRNRETETGTVSWCCV
jgi:hypothetical protein